MNSSGSSGRVRGGKKHEIYAAAFGGHPFYILFSQAPLDPLLMKLWIFTRKLKQADQKVSKLSTAIEIS